MDLSDVHFTEKEVQDFMDSLDINEILDNIDKMPSDEDYETSFSHGMEFDFNSNSTENKILSMKDLDNETEYRLVKNFEMDLIA